MRLACELGPTMEPPQGAARVIRRVARIPPQESARDAYSRRLTMSRYPTPSSFLRIAKRWGVLAMSLCGFVGLSAAPASAVVQCSEASLDAALATGGYHVFLGCGPGGSQPPGDLILSAEKTISVDTTIDFPAPVNGGNILSVFGRIFTVLPGVTLELRGLTLAGASQIGQGGLIRNEGTLLLSGVTLRGGSATEGGGALANFGVATIENSTIEDNTATSSGGGLYLASGSTTTIRGSTILRNTVFADLLSTAEGGGLFNDGTLLLENSTVAENHSENLGGALFTNGGSSTVSFSTFTDNTADGAGSVRAGAATTTVSGSILNGTCASALTSGGHNLESPGDTCGLGATGDLVDVGESDLALEARALDTGRNELYRLGRTSVARDTGGLAGCPATDQRGATRPDVGRGVACDIGAFEDSGIALTEIQKLLDQGQPDPRGGSTLQQFEIVGRSGDQIALMAVDSLGERSLYLHDGTGLSHIAGEATPVPGGLGTFFFPEDFVPIIQLSAHEGQFAFIFRAPRVPNPMPPPSQVFSPNVGIYLFSQSQPVTRCAGIGDLTASGDPFSDDGYPQLDLYQGTVTFPGDGIKTCDGTDFETLVPPTKILSNGDLIRRDTSPNAAIRNDADGLFFEARRRIFPLSGGSSLLDSGTYQYDAVLDEAILFTERRQTLDFGGDIQFTNGAITFAESATLLAATAADGLVLTDDGNGGVTEHGVVRTGIGTFTMSDGVAYFSRSARFSSFITPLPFDCFLAEGVQIGSTFGGSFEALLSAGDVFDDKTVSCALAGNDFADGPDLAFAVWFTDGTQAVYTATVPEPHTVPGLGFGALMLAGLARKERRRFEAAD